MLLFDEETQDWFNAIKKVLEDRQGAVSFIPLNLIEKPETVIRSHLDIISYEVASFHKDYLKLYGHLYRGQTVSMLRHGQEIKPQMVTAARRSMADLRAKIMQEMDKYKLDCLMTPATINSAPLGLSSTGDPAACIPWTHAGVPTIAIPTPIKLNGMPQGLQLIGRFLDDTHLCACSELISGLLATAVKS